MKNDTINRRISAVDNGKSQRHRLHIAINITAAILQTCTIEEITDEDDKQTIIDRMTLLHTVTVIDSMFW